MTEKKKVPVRRKKKAIIDFEKMFQDLWKHKRSYYLTLPITFLLAAIYALGIPEYYTCNLKLSPEMTGSEATNSLVNLASSFGVDVGAQAGFGTDAIFPTLYPDLMQSNDFKTSLFSVKVLRESDGKEFSYYDYLDNEQKSPWWSNLLKYFNNMFSADNKKPTVKEKTTKLDPFRLELKDARLMMKMERKIRCTVDKKTMVLTISVTDQDPVIAARMADSVKTHLQEAITDYRTKKARADYEYKKKIYAEAKLRYEKARQEYVEYYDHNQDVLMKRVQSKIESLENELQLQYTIYQQVTGELIQADMKVQEETPAFAVLQSATVPVFREGPKRSHICLTWLLIAFMATSCWVLYKEDDLKSLLGFNN